MPNVAPLPDLVLYARPECSLCDEAREAVEIVVADRRARGLAVPNVIERNIESDPELHRALLERIPVVELGGTAGRAGRLDREASATPQRGARRHAGTVGEAPETVAEVPTEA